MDRQGLVGSASYDTNSVGPAKKFLAKWPKQLYRHLHCVYCIVSTSQGSS